MKNLLEVNHVVKKYGDFIALNDVSIHIPKGCVFGLLGPNGAGKTTLIRIINQIIYSDSGEIYLDNELLNKSHLSRIGYLPEERGLYKKMKVKEQLSYFASLRNFKNSKESINLWLEKFDLTEWANKKVEELSKGMQQKVQFINAVIHEPDFIILDEPFSGFDPVNVNLVINEIRRLNKNGSTILYSTHRMDSVEELCDEIMMISNAKKVVEGKINEVKNSFKDNAWEVGVETDLTLEQKEKWKAQKVPNSLPYSKYKIWPDLVSDNWKVELQSNNNILFLQESLPSIHEIFIKHAH